jgi:ABC-type branched-subunit amino acid transport system ATPase component
LLLDLADVAKHFGGVRAVNGVTAQVQAGSIVGLIGPNGSGKTTLLNVIAGALKPTSGHVVLDGKDTRSWTPSAAARAGVGRAFQIPQTMDDLTVLENCMLGAMFGSRRWDKGAARTAAHEALEEAELSESARARAGELSLAGRKQLELARLLATAPRLALVDEVMAGLSPAQVGVAERALFGLRERNTALILVEHVPGVIARMADDIIVLHHGNVLAHGNPQEILSNQDVVDAYLGTSRN